MSYTQESLAGTLLRLSNAHDTAQSLVAAPGVYGAYLVTRSMKVKRIMFYVTTQSLTATVAPVVEFKRRPTYNSATGELSIGTLTIPSGSTVGQVIYKDVTPYSLFAGDVFSLQLKTQGTDPGAAAGAGFFGFELEDDPETPANQSKMVASA